MFLTRDALMRHAAASVTEALFPETLHVADADFPLAYRFAPGHPLDGLTLTVPLAQLNQIDAATLSWLVPGMIREKVAHVIKALPKAWRNRLIPIPETVTAFLERSRAERAALTDALRDYLTVRLGDAPPAATLAEVELPTHLRVNVRWGANSRFSTRKPPAASAAASPACNRAAAGQHGANATRGTRISASCRRR
jgi:ATP-dependent helicase HrpA